MKSNHIAHVLGKASRYNFSKRNLATEALKVQLEEYSDDPTSME